MWDDKAKINHGEPDLAIPSGVRGKKSIVPINTVLGALDHDINSKGSLTASICLKVDIPEELDSFYHGQIVVTLKDSVLQPSSPFRHGVEIKSILEDNCKLVLMLFSDRDPDHWVTFHSVQLSLISISKEKNLHMLIATRTTPGHSLVNPVEGAISLLNLVYQNFERFLWFRIQTPVKKMQWHGRY